MACCSGGAGYPAADQQFGSASAQRDLARYHRKGLDASSRVLLEAVAEIVRHGDSLVDVGGGVGVVSFELLTRGVEHATVVDASSAYLNAAQSEADRRHVRDRVDVVKGDVVHLDGAVAEADIVTMHRVVCCYPDWIALLGTATRLSRRLLAFSYPRDIWYVRAFMGLDNVRRRIFGNAFRTFVHSPNAMDQHIVSAGFDRITSKQTAVWCVSVYVRRESA